MDVLEHTKIEIDPELYMLKTYDDNAIVSNIKKNSGKYVSKYLMNLPPARVVINNRKI